MKREHTILAFVIVRDCLFIMIAAFSGILLFEGLLPGFISGHISLSLVALTALVPAIILAILARRLSIQGVEINKKTTLVRIVGYLFLITLVTNALRKFSLTFIFLSVLAFAIIVFLFEQSVSDTKKNQSKTE